jgi:signal peptidase I
VSDFQERIEQAAAPQPALQPQRDEINMEAVDVPAQQPSSAPVGAVQPTRGPQGIQFVVSVLVIVVFMITFVMQAFRVPSESMENTLLIGDFLLADKLHFAEPC